MALLCFDEHNLRTVMVADADAEEAEEAERLCRGWQRLAAATRGRPTPAESQATTTNYGIRCTSERREGCRETVTVIAWDQEADG